MIEDIFADKKKLYMDSLVEDMSEDLPSLIIVNTKVDENFIKDTKTHIEFCLEDERFKEIWSNYSKMTTISTDHTTYDFYLRNDLKEI